MRKQRRMTILVLCLIMSLSQLVDAVDYSYDGLGRLSGVSYDDGSKIEYIYDAVGNILNVISNKDPIPPKVDPLPGDGTNTPDDDPVRPAYGHSSSTSSKNKDDDKEEEKEKELELDKSKEETYFKDTKGHWAEENINLLANKGIISGYPDGSFKPDSFITRFEIAVLVTNALEKEEDGEIDLYFFADHKEIPGWAEKSVGLLSLKGIINGYPEGDGSLIFAGNRLITRSEMALILSNITKTYKSDIVGQVNFNDENIIPSWGLEAIKSMTGKNIIKGYPDKTFRPGNNLTRAEAATMVANTLKYLGDL